MMGRLTTAGAAIILAGVLLSGCAGVLALAAQIIGLVQAGEALGLINDSDPVRYTAYMDGYELGLRASTSGSLNITGMPQGVHLLSLANPGSRRGWHRQVQITGGGSLNLGQINPFDGAAIRGRVTREASDGGTVPLAGAQVIAIRGAADLLSGPTAAPIPIPPPLPSDPANPQVEYIAGFTDDSGEYLLGPARYGSWMVFVARPGFIADATLAEVSSGSDAAGRDMHLAADRSAAAGSVGGQVSYADAGRALVYATLQTPLAAQVSSATRVRLENLLGHSLTSGPWLSLQRTAVLTAPSGDYVIPLPTGRHSLIAFKYGFRAQEAVANVSADDRLSLDFRLPRRG